MKFVSCRNFEEAKSLVRSNRFPVVEVDLHFYKWCPGPTHEPQFFPIEDFVKAKKRDWLQNKCKACRRHEWRLTHPPKKRRPGPKVYKFVNGEVLKRCRGKLHREGTYLPLSAFGFENRDGEKLPKTQCRACCSKAREGNEIVPWKQVRFIFQELVFRVGSNEARRRCGINTNSWHLLFNNNQAGLRKKFVVNGMLALKAAREKDEVRHKHSIKHGAYLRGHKEKQVKTERDYYSQFSDEEQFQKRLRKEKARASNQ